jgi:hypothetical protein
LQVSESGFIFHSATFRRRAFLAKGNKISEMPMAYKTLMRGITRALVSFRLSLIPGWAGFAALKPEHGVEQKRGPIIGPLFIFPARNFPATTNVGFSGA